MRMDRTSVDGLNVSFAKDLVTARIGVPKRHVAYLKKWEGDDTLIVGVTGRMAGLSDAGGG